jgi:hypothetical protein
MDDRLIFLYHWETLSPMGGRGKKSYRTDSLVRASLREAHRKIRVRNPRGDAERLVREVAGPTAEKIL